MFGHLFNRVLAPEDNARLRPSEELVSAGGHDVAPALDRSAKGGCRSGAQLGRIQDCSTAQVVHHRYTVSISEGSQVRCGDFLGKSHDPEVARMATEEQSGVLCDSALEVAQTGAVGCADFDEGRSAGA